MSISVVGPKVLSLPPSAGGNPAMWDLVQLASSRGLVVQDLSDGRFEIAGITNRDFLPIETVQDLVAAGCEVEGYDAVFELDDIDAEVPETFPNRIYDEPTDPDDPESESTTHVHTWATWGQDGGRVGLAPREIDGTYYRTSQDGATGGVPIPASAWVPASLVGLTVLAEMPVVDSGAEV